MRGTPPKWADRVLQWYCRREKLEDLQGDLYEYYYRNQALGGSKWANWIYFLDVIKFFRIYTVKKLKIGNSMNVFYLFENYWKTAFRSIARSKLFSVINIFGLAISSSIGIIMIVFISELWTFDEFHEKYERIYRVNSIYESLNTDEPIELASTGVLIGNRLKEDFTGLEEVLIMRRGYGGDVKFGDKILSLEGIWAGESFFDIFSFEVIHGNPAMMLSEPYSMVITEGTAIKLFGEEDPMGKSVLVDGEDNYLITGVVADPPPNSHLQFEVLSSFATHVQKESKRENSRLTNWNNIWMYHVYVLLEEGTDPQTIAGHLTTISEEENAASDRYWINLYLEHLGEIIPGKDLSNRIGPQITTENLLIVSLLTIIVILSACFNYTNLSVARSLRRAKEVGIRKVVGATGRQVFYQFILEAVVISTFAIVVAVGLFFVLRPQFLHLDPTETLPVSLILKPIHYVYFLAFAVALGFFSGFLPAVIMSKVRSLMALRDTSKMKLLSGVNLRKALLVFQFTLCIGFIIAATINYRQYHYAVNFDLGFNTEDVLNISIKGNDSKLLATAFSQVPGVKTVSRSAFVLSSGSIWTDKMKYQDPMDSVFVHLCYVDENFIDVHGFEMLAGENIPQRPDSANVKFILANEKVLERFNMGSPQDAIGLMIDLNDEEKQIIGVVRNFQHQTIEGELEPFIFLRGPDNYQYLNLKVQTGDVIGLMDRLENEWRKIDEIHPFEARFFDDDIQRAYAEYQMIFKLVGFLSVLAISIACLGLLGIAIYSTESRLKEIGIRKVLGASERNLVYLLSRGFMVILLVATAIALPVTFYIFDRIVLSDQANRITIGIVELSFGALLILLIGLLTIGWQTLKAAKTNPATILRDE